MNSQQRSNQKFTTFELFCLEVAYAKVWILGVVLILISIPIHKDCWLNWKMRNAPVVEGNIVGEKKEVLRYFFVRRYEISLETSSVKELVKTEVGSDSPDSFYFRWDGKAEEVYLGDVWGNPWNNLILIYVLLLFFIASILFFRWCRKQGT